MPGAAAAGDADFAVQILCNSHKFAIYKKRIYIQYTYCTEHTLYMHIGIGTLCQTPDELEIKAREIFCPMLVRQYRFFQFGKFALWQSIIARKKT